jgi:hypothetical protein
MLMVPVFILFWVPLNPGWMTSTVIISALVFSTALCLSSKIKVKEVLLGCAA